jgi:hypothetical protein
VSGGELESLSDIIFRYGLGDIAEKGLLINLIYFLDSNKLKFPISYNLMNRLWDKNYFVSSFNAVLSELVSANLVSTKRLNAETFFSSVNINKDIDDVEGEPNYLVVSGTSLLNELLSALLEKQVLVRLVNREGSMILAEGVNFTDLDKKYKEFAMSLRNSIRSKLLIGMSFESFEYDSLKNIIEFNFVFMLPKVEKYLKEADLTRIFKKWIKSSMLIEFTSTFDGIGRVFLGMSLDMRIMPSDLKQMSENIYGAVNEILDLIEKGA